MPLSRNLPRGKGRLWGTKLHMGWVPVGRKESDMWVYSPSQGRDVWIELETNEEVLGYEVPVQGSWAEWKLQELQSRARMDQNSTGVWS